MDIPKPVAYEIYTGGELTLPDNMLCAYYLAGNGVFKYAESCLLRALIQLQKVNVAGLPHMTPFVEVCPGRLHTSTLEGILTDARRIARHQRAEAMYHVHALGHGNYAVRRPAQKAGPGRIEYQGGDDADIILDIHSHPDTRAYFSETDRRDEGGFRLYAVMGQLFAYKPEIVMNVGVYGDFARVPVTTLFKGAGDFEEANYAGH